MEELIGKRFALTDAMVPENVNSEMTVINITRSEAVQVLM